MNYFNRRGFLKTSALLAGATLIGPTLLSCQNPNSKLNIAVIGVGGRGRANYNPILETENIVAMCDVDDIRAKDGYEKIKSSFPDVKKFSDFRVMFDKMHKEIDAVIISTPDHTHFAPAMIAMELGKHVYMEKPLAHNVWECRTLKKAAKYYNIVSQMGNQGHTTNGVRQIKEWYEAGILGEVKEVHAWIGSFDFRPGHYWSMPESFPPPKQEIPKNLNWDLWLGPAKSRDYNSVYVPKSWRGFFDFGNGQLGDWSCHTLDGPFWALNLGMPSEIKSYAENRINDHHFVCEKSIVTYKFPKRVDRQEVTMKWYEGGYKPEINPAWPINELAGAGMIMVGSKNSLITGGRPNNPRLLVSDEEWNEFQNNMPKQTIPRLKWGDETPVHEWIDAIKNNYLPESNFSYGAELTEMALLGTLSQRFASRIEYDSENMRITNRPDINEYLKEPARDGWRYGESIN